MTRPKWYIYVLKDKYSLNTWKPYDQWKTVKEIRDTDLIEDIIRKNIRFKNGKNYCSYNGHEFEVFFDREGAPFIQLIGQDNTYAGR